MDITDEAHDLLHHVVEGLRQDVTALEQEVTTYGFKNGDRWYWRSHYRAV